MPPLPAKDKLTIGFAHAAYQMAERFAARNTGIRHFQVRALDDLKARAPEADVIVVSMMWRNELIATAPKLRFVQSISAGVDQYDKEAFRKAGIRLASAAGVNANAVAEHALSLMLALDRQLPMARDNQAKKFWRPMAPTIAAREAELAGRTLVIVGLGRIGGRIAELGRAFRMHVIGVKRNPAAGAEGCHEVVATADLDRVLPKADVVVLACPLTPETENLIGARALALLKPTAHLVNVARGKVVDEEALVAALSSGKLKAAALDVTREEPLAEASPLWTLPNVFITPHTGGETQAYEDNVIDVSMDNLDRLWRGQSALKNEVV